MPHLDNNASTRMDETVFRAMETWLRSRSGANPSSLHRAGREARAAIELARGEVANLLGASPESILLTSGASESITTAIHSATALQPQRRKILTSALDHAATRRAAALAVGDENVLLLPLRADGCYDLEALATILAEERDQLALVSLIWASNDTGILPGLPEAASIISAAGVPVHADAVQAVGRIPVDVSSVPVDFLSLSGHKIHGPPGTGALFVRPGIRFRPLIPGGGQENGRRGGTENVPGIVGLGMAARFAAAGLAEMPRLESWRDEFEKRLAETVGETEVIGGSSPRLPNTSCMRFGGAASAAALVLLDEAGLACSAGSACTSHSPEPPAALLALGLDRVAAMETLRFSLSRLTEREELELALEIIPRVMVKVRAAGASVGGVVRKS
ncbi:MAG: cysteine desulfurase family protein [Verrucomicrobiales bacterium]